MFGECIYACGLVVAGGLVLLALAVHVWASGWVLLGALCKALPSMPEPTDGCAPQGNRAGPRPVQLLP